MAVTIIPNVTNWSVTPQNGQVGYFTLMNTWLSESTLVIASLQTAINAQNTANSEINALAIQAAANSKDARNARNEALTAVATLQGGAIDNTTIANNKAYSNQKTNDLLSLKLDKDFSTLTDKTTPSDTDIFAIRETGGLLKKTSWTNIKATLKTYFDISYVALTGNQTVAGVKTFSSNIVGNITGNAGTATKLSTTRANYKDATNSVVAGELMWKKHGNYHTIFDASDATAPNGTAIDAANPNVPWGIGQPTLMGFSGVGTFGVRVDSARVADSATYAAAFTTAVGSAPSYACRAWVNFNGTGTVAIRASGNVSSVTDNGVGDYAVNFTTAMPDANYNIVGTAREDSAGNTANFSLGSNVGGTPLPTTTSFKILLTNNVSQGFSDSTIICASIFR